PGVRRDDARDERAVAVAVVEALAVRLDVVAAVVQAGAEQRVRVDAGVDHRDGDVPTGGDLLRARDVQHRLRGRHRRGRPGTSGGQAGPVLAELVVPVRDPARGWDRGPVVEV